MAWLHGVWSDAILGRRTPIEVRRAGAAAYRNTEALAVLMEQWVSCEGQWNESEFMKTVKSEKHQRTRGRREWLTRHQLAVKVGSEELAKQTVDAKETDMEASKSQVRLNPDMHGKDSPDSWTEVAHNLKCFALFLI